MTTWTSAALNKIGAVEELRIASQRRDHAAAEQPRQADALVRAQRPPATEDVEQQAVCQSIAEWLALHNFSASSATQAPATILK